MSKWTKMFCAVWLWVMTQNVAPVLAQVPVEIFYSHTWVLVPEPVAAFKRQAVMDTLTGALVGQVKDFYITGSIAMEGAYVNAKPQGAFTFYYPNSTLEREGNYQAGTRAGKWNFYWPNGKPKFEIYFRAGRDSIVQAFDSLGVVLVKNGTGKFAYAATPQEGPGSWGQLLITGNVKEGLRTGVWRMGKGENEIWVQETFENGQFKSGKAIGTQLPYKTESRTALPEFLKFKTTPKFEFSSSFKNVNEALQYIFQPHVRPRYDSIANANASKVLVSAEVMPEFPGGQQELRRYFQKQMYYPASLGQSKSAPSGTVVVSFVISKEGKAEGIEIKKGLHALIDDQVISIINHMPLWKPGMHNGKKVAVKFTIPLKYSIIDTPIKKPTSPSVVKSGSEEIW